MLTRSGFYWPSARLPDTGKLVFPGPGINATPGFGPHIVLSRTMQKGLARKTAKPPVGEKRPVDSRRRAVHRMTAAASNRNPSPCWRLCDFARGRSSLHLDRFGLDPVPDFTLGHETASRTPHPRRSTPWVASRFCPSEWPDRGFG